MTPSAYSLPTSHYKCTPILLAHTPPTMTYNLGLGIKKDKLFGRYCYLTNLNSQEPTIFP